MEWQPIEEFDGREGTEAWLWRAQGVIGPYRFEAEPESARWFVWQPVDWVKSHPFEIAEEEVKAHGVTHFCIMRDPDGRRVDGLED